MDVSLRHLMHIDATLGEEVDFGQSPFGYRRVVPITGGFFKGERLNGSVIGYGADWALVRHDEVLTIDTRYLLKTDDDVFIGITNKGMVRGEDGLMDKIFSGGDVDRGALYTRLYTFLEAPAGKYEWLNRSVFVTVLHPPETMERATLDVYEFI